MISELTRLPGKIQPSHKARKAALYIRQSTLHQLTEHQESTQRQYQLIVRLEQLGWNKDDVIVIDQDLGSSGSHSQRRAGFASLLQMITRGEIGIVLGLEMSRLARNSKDWHDLFEVCAIFESLIADEDGIFNPNDPNDRLVLGLKGMISEMELHTMKVRLQRGRMNKARRGELFHDAPVGFIKNEKGQLDLDPDQSAQGALREFFRSFEVVGSASGLFHYLAENQIKMPFRKDPQGRHLTEIQWRIPKKTSVLEMLHNPTYAGTYGYGRRKNYHSKNRKKQGAKHLPPDQWTVCLVDHFEGYITWQQYLDNLQRLQGNNSRGKRTSPPRGGQALISGLVFCAMCQRRLAPTYSGKNVSYFCNRHQTMHGVTRCGTALVSRVIDGLVTTQILKVLSPSSLELQFQVIGDEVQRRETVQQQYVHKLERATYAVDLAHRRYEAVDPANRLVAATLEQKWEQALAEKEAATTALEEQKRLVSTTLSRQEQEEMKAACADVENLWDRATILEQKQLVRFLIEKVNVQVENNSDQVVVTIQWTGGFESVHSVVRPVHRFDQLACYDELLKVALELALKGKRSPEIAAELNAQGYRTPRRQRLFSASVTAKLLADDKSAYTQLHHPELGPNDWEVKRLADEISMPIKRLKDWVTKGWAHATQRPFGRTWVIWADEQELSRLKQLRARQAGNNNSNPPKELTRPGIERRVTE